LKKEHLVGNIQFVNVQFSYPSRPDISILNSLSFNVKHGQTVAIVGASGSGKSTCVQLLQRFYDLQSGSIFIDGKQINQYNLKWLRQQIGVVSQEPILFQTTIRENILFGRDSATDNEIYQAAKMANAHQFIMSLPDVRKLLRRFVV
jgi:ABC-type multidrug transport system fused ATPase/permease subunit